MDINELNERKNLLMNSMEDMFSNYPEGAVQTIIWIKAFSEICEEISFTAEEYEKMYKALESKKYEKGMNCYENFNKEDKNNFAGWVVGQFMSGVEYCANCGGKYPYSGSRRTDLFEEEFENLPDFQEYVLNKFPQIKNKNKGVEETIIGKISIEAIMKWEGLSNPAAREKVIQYGNAEELNNNITYGSEISAINGIAQILHLSDSEKEELINDVHTKSEVSEELAKKIREGINYNSIIEVLSVIHDNWVKDNSNKFGARPKDYQFVPLALLPFEEVESDLIFLNGILKGCNYEIDREKLKKQFITNQVEFLKQHKISSRKDLNKFLKGKNFYPALEDLKSNRGDKGRKAEKITDIIKRDRILRGKMLNQIEGKIGNSIKIVKGREGLKNNGEAYLKGQEK